MSQCKYSKYYRVYRNGSLLASCWTRKDAEYAIVQNKIFDRNAIAQGWETEVGQYNIREPKLRPFKGE